MFPNHRPSWCQQNSKWVWPEMLLANLKAKHCTFPNHRQSWCQQNSKWVWPEMLLANLKAKHRTFQIIDKAEVNKTVSESDQKCYWRISNPKHCTFPNHQQSWSQLCKHNMTLLSFLAGRAVKNTHTNTQQEQQTMTKQHQKHRLTVLPAKSDSDVMFCLQSYQGLVIDRLLVY